jgi:ribose transport system ATP-binding protein
LGKLLGPSPKVCPNCKTAQQRFTRANPGFFDEPYFGFPAHQAAWKDRKEFVTQSNFLLEMKDIVKVFPGNVALDQARLEVQPGEVHALVGQNGAGKSTMIKILTGAYLRDGGTILFDGKEVAFQTPQEATANGISTIYQEINLVPLRSVAENIMMGREPVRFGLIDWRRLNREAKEILEQVGIFVDVTRPLQEFNIAVQQMVAIARAVSFHSKLVVFDEPTSSLDDNEVETLFQTIRRLKANGVAVIFITHRLDELYAICDRITIMRDGRTIETRDMQSISKIELVSKMLGRELGEVVRSGVTSFDANKARSKGSVIIETEEVGNGFTLQSASLKIHAGEIVGLAGLLGSGRSETARVIFGSDPVTSGEMRLKGKKVKFASPNDAIRAGIGFCSEDRKAEGIIPHLSVRENLTLALLPHLAKFGIVDKARQNQVVDEFIAALGIKVSAPEQKIRELSGGNQQKVLLARWLCMNPQLLILDEPTRGIDVGAKGEIQKIISKLAEDGVGVLMITSEIEELTEGSDRVVVMRDRCSVAELERQAIHQDEIMNVMAHGSETREPAPTNDEGKA